MVITVHGLHSLRRSSGLARSAAIVSNRAVLKRADAVLVLNAADATTIETERLAPKTQVSLIRPSFQPPTDIDRVTAREQLGLPGDARVVAWVGRFSEQKDPHTLINAIERVDAAGVLYVMAGDGPLFESIRRETLHGDRKDQVVLTGWLDDPSILLAAADVFVSTARWEGLALTVLQAAACGLPLILSDCAGNTDVIVSGSERVLFPIGDAGELAKRVSAFIEEPEPFARSGKDMSNLVKERFTVANLVKDVEAAYSDLAKVGGDYSETS